VTVVGALSCVSYAANRKRVACEQAGGFHHT